MSTVEVYDPRTDTWTTAAPLPTREEGAAAFTTNGRIYLVGGSDSSGLLSQQITTVLTYDPATNHWTRARPPSSTPDGVSAVRYSHGVLTIIDGNGTLSTQLYHP